MNQLPFATRKKILQMLVEGSSMRSVARVNDLSFNTVKKLLIEAGQACIEFHDNHVRDVRTSVVQCDEMWTYVHAKQKTVKRRSKVYAYRDRVLGRKPRPEVMGLDWQGDAWTWTAVDKESKLLISWVLGERTNKYANLLAADLKDRLADGDKVTLASDGLTAYLDAFDTAWDEEEQVDFARTVKLYTDTGRYKGSSNYAHRGSPASDDFGTTTVERHNLTIRMGQKRYTRRSNAFSKKLENHNYSLALFFVFYNFIRPHMTLNKRNKGRPTTPAMAAKLAHRPFTWEGLLAYIDNRKPPVKRGPYQPHQRPNARKRPQPRWVNPKPYKGGESRVTRRIGNELSA